MYLTSLRIKHRQTQTQNTNKYQECKTTKPQNHKTTKSQNHKIIQFMFTTYNIIYNTYNESFLVIICKNNEYPDCITVLYA